MASFAELDNFLNSPEADFGLTPRARQLIFETLGDEEEAFKYFVKVVVVANDNDGDKSSSHAARSYRAMTLLKQDLAMTGMAPVLIRNPTHAGLLAKDLLAGLSTTASTSTSSSQQQRYSQFHIRELLDALLEAFPEKVLGAASSGGQAGVKEHFVPLLQSDQTLQILTHLVCLGCTGRKGIASAEKSAQHTAMYHHQSQMAVAQRITLGHRRKFVKAMADFHLMDQLVRGLTTNTCETSSSLAQYDDAGEELCETILTIIEVVGYPPEVPPTRMGEAPSIKKDEGERVGEDILLAPLTTPEWWKELLEAIQNPHCTYTQREAIARVCHQTFALATGQSSRICKSHAPATDATEQTSEQLVEEVEETVQNRLVDWGLTDQMHAALVSQLPLLIQALDLPRENILEYQATCGINPTAEDNANADMPTIRHPGRYQTVPLGSWRLQLLSLLKEIITYRGKAKDGKTAVQGMEAIMQLPIPPEVQKAKKGKEAAVVSHASSEQVIYNPWPALCSFVWAYPNNDFYHITFFNMLQAAVLEHHEATLRLVLQKSKFLTRAVRSLDTDGTSVRALTIQCLNLLYLRSVSLPPSAFLTQYLSSHDGWKENVNKLSELTLNQQTPIKSDQNFNLNLGGPYAAKLGLSDISEWDASSVATTEVSTADEGAADATHHGDKKSTGGKKKKKNKKKKKK